jgi:hypothetical protein
MLLLSLTFFLSIILRKEHLHVAGEKKKKVKKNMHIYMYIKHC